MSCPTVKMRGVAASDVNPVAACAYRNMVSLSWKSTLTFQSERESPKTSGTSERLSAGPWSNVLVFSSSVYRAPPDTLKRSVKSYVTWKNADWLSVV